MQNHRPSFLPSTIKPILALLLLSLLLTILIYSPGLSGGFIFDDIGNIVENEALKIDHLEKEPLIAAALSGHAGPLKRPISLLSFAFNYYAVGDFSPYYFKLTNLLIHLTNGIGLFLLTTLILTAYKKTSYPRLEQQRIYVISLIACTIWLVHPINLTSVLYVVQRMNSLSSLFVIWGLVFYAWGRIRLISAKPALPIILVSFPVFLGLAALSKENGILLPVFMLALEITIFRFSAPTKKGKYIIQGLFGITVLLPAIIFLIFIATQPQWITSSYLTRDFSLTERILTEPRVLWFYISLILIPTQGRLGIFHDDIAISTSIFEPSSTFFAITSLALALTIAIYSVKRAPLLSFGIFFFLFGHSLESSIFALDIAYEHRNYLPSYGLIVAVVFYALHTAPKQNKTLLLKNVASVAVILTLSSITFARADYWSHPLKHSDAEAQHHPYSPRANTFVGIEYLKLAKIYPEDSKELLALATKHLQTSTQLDRKNTTALFNIIGISQMAGEELNTTQVKELLYRLEHQPFTPSTVSGINHYISCVKHKECPGLQDIIKPIFDASLKNPTVSGRAKSEILTMASKYSYETLLDNESALYLIAQAAETTPNNPRYRLHLVTLLHSLGRLDDAEKELDAASRLDPFGQHSLAIKRHRKSIAETRGKLNRQYQQ